MSNTYLHSGNDFKDSIVDGTIRDVADMFEGVIGDTGRRLVEDIDAPSSSVSISFAISSAEDQNNRTVEQ